jgi:hypothetical protein
MRWFGRKGGVGAAPRPFLLGGWGAAAAAGEWPRSYEAQVREAFLGNPVAQRAVRLVAEAVGSVSVYSADEKKVSPSTGSGRAASLLSSTLLETVAGHVLLHGNAFVQVLQDGEGVPAELFALRPERVTIEAGADGWPAAYLYRAGEARVRLPVRDGLGRPSLVHVRALHPLDDHLGLGCLGAAAGAVAIHNAATRFHNEALTLVDAALHPAVEGGPLNGPPAAPAVGQCWLVGSVATGAWAGQADALAIWTAGGWRFVTPQPGMLVWDKAAEFHRRWMGTGWSEGDLAGAFLTIGGKQVVGQRGDAIASPSGGTIIDLEARAAVIAVIVALRTHGLIE